MESSLLHHFSKFLGTCMVVFVLLVQYGHCQGADDIDPLNGSHNLPQIAWPPLMSLTAAHLLEEHSNGIKVGDKNVTIIPLVPRNRLDPLDHFRRYKAGYDIESKHYWASTIFTGVYGYAIGAVWVLLGLLFGLFLIMRWCCCRGRKKDIDKPQSAHRHRYYIWPFVLVILLTLALIVTTSFALSGNKRFHTRAKRVEKTIVGAADSATNTIYNVTSTMKLMQDYMQPYDRHAYERLNSIAEKLDAEAVNIHNKVYDNKHAIDLGLRVLYIVSTVILCVNLALAILVIALLLLHWCKTLFLIIFISWLMTTIIWLGFGLYFAIHTFADDSCLALKEYQHDPYNTTLDSILPCVDLEEAEASLTESRQAVHVLLGEVNRNISRFSRLSGGLLNVPHICDPFTGAPDFEYKPDDCPNGTIQIGDLPNVLANYTCSGNETQNCSVVQIISQATFDEAKAYTKAIQSLLDIFPQLQTLANCSFVKDTFSEIVNNQCSPVKSSINIVWTSFVAVASTMVFLVISWIIKAYQNRGRQFSKGSVIPHDI